MAQSKPEITSTTHILPFDKLSPLDFERLCLWLVEREGYARAEHLGLAGSEQGRDVIAYRPAPGGEQLWYFQCKRYAAIRAKTLKDEVDKYLELVGEKPHLKPFGVVFVVSCAVSARVREEVGSYCEEHGLAYGFWALTELDAKVKRHPAIVEEFFQAGRGSRDSASGIRAGRIVADNVVEGVQLQGDVPPDVTGLAELAGAVRRGGIEAEEIEAGHVVDGLQVIADPAPDTPDDA
jgi:hypothetical protein